MDKETLSNYGWIVICVLVLAVMIALATPFGSYISEGTQSTVEGLFATQQSALEVVGIELEDSEVIPPTVEELITQGIVPEGATYTSADGTVYNTGDTMPTPQYLDAFRYGDYTYVYSADYYNRPYTASFENQFCNGGYNGWLVTIRQETSDGTDYRGYQLKKSSYGAILESINGQPITCMSGTFYNCTALTTAPTIPSSVTYMNSTFNGCTKLTTAPAIPSSVTSLYGTFSGCTALTEKISIPCTLQSKNHSYSNCPATIEYYHVDTNTSCSCNS